MTTIAYRNGAIAGDTLVSGGGIHDCSAIKVARNERGDLAGASGTAHYCYHFLEWFRGGEKNPAPDVPEDNEAFIVRAADPILIECWEEPGRFVVSAPYYAVGSGKRLALGAMAFGATADQAVNCAAKHCVQTGGDVTVLYHAG
ncbi:hypothetical protein GOC16_08285 [Sinorhizobium meliloti]|nr:hypothetical protein [Sinorhizobium meliloti]